MNIEIPQLAEILNELRGLKAEFLAFKNGLNPNKLSYSVKEAAEATGLSVDTIYNKVHSGEIKAGQGERKGKIVIPRTEIERMINELVQKNQI